MKQSVARSHGATSASSTYLANQCSSIPQLMPVVLKLQISLVLLALFLTENSPLEAIRPVNPGACLLPPKYKEMGQRIYDMQVRPDDVWVVSYPRNLPILMGLSSNHINSAHRSIFGSFFYRNEPL
ncbi:unnamed protein product [Nesidiocoris tenuis]|uniref:Uncharacterized protein n=1 Tax=Nesidiocoris tenuis TaxID=355587 RepID=A0A6H5H2P1_9HEMI|nr:unnamed protein product [Nesidiocoris tenuis]